MGELSDLFVRKFGKNKNDSADLIRKSQVKNTILELINTLLQPGDELVFEVSNKDLPYTILVVSEDPIKSLVSVEQMSETLFKAKLLDLNIEL